MKAMPYSKNTIICSGNINPEILEKKTLKLIVLTQDEEFVGIADFVAQQAPMGFDRYVVWVKDVDFDSIRTQIPHLPEKLTTVLAFSLSTINKVASFMSEGDIIDIPGIDYLFILAGDIKYNQKP